MAWHVGSAVMLCCRLAAQVYGCQPKWKKLMKQLAGRRTEEKFDEVVQVLTELTTQVWELQEEGGQGSSTSRCGGALGAAHALQTPHVLLPGCGQECWAMRTALYHSASPTLETGADWACGRMRLQHEEKKEGGCWA
jgi:hypothetical protein